MKWIRRGSESITDSDTDPSASHGPTQQQLDPPPMGSVLLRNHLFTPSGRGLQSFMAICPAWPQAQHITQAASSHPQHVASAEHPLGGHPAPSQETLGSEDLADPRADCSSSDSFPLAAGNMSLISCLRCPQLEHEVPADVPLAPGAGGLQARSQAGSTHHRGRDLPGMGSSKAPCCLLTSQHRGILLLGSDPSRPHPAPEPAPGLHPHALARAGGWEGCRAVVFRAVSFPEAAGFQPAESQVRGLG